MRHLFGIVSIGVGATLAMSSPALAQTAPNTNCAPRQAVVERLGARYGESRQSIGIGSNNSVVEVFASTETGTWTIVVTMPTGVSCLVAAGQAFEAVAEAPVAKGNDA